MLAPKFGLVAGLWDVDTRCRLNKGIGLERK